MENSVAIIIIILSVFFLKAMDADIDMHWEANNRRWIF